MTKIRIKPTSGKPKVLDKVSILQRNIKKPMMNTRFGEIDTRDTPENYATEKASDGTSTVVKEGLGETKKRVDQIIGKGKQAWKNGEKKTNSHEGWGRHAGKDAKQKTKYTSNQTSGRGQANRVKNTCVHIRHKAKGGQKSVRAVRQRTQGAIRKAGRRIRKVQYSIDVAKRTIKTSAKTANVAAKTTKTTAKLSMRMARAATKAAATGVKLLAKAVVATVKAASLAIKSLVAIIAAGGWVVLVIVIVVGAILFIVDSAFGIFYSNEDTGESGAFPMSQVVKEINYGFSSYIDKRVADASAGHENVTVVYDSGIDGDGNNINNWVDVLAIYAVKMTMSETDPLEVVTVTKEKKQVLKDLYWKMNTVSVQITTETEEVLVIDDEGNETTETVEKTTIYVEVTSEDYLDAAQRLGFNKEQYKMLEELMTPENYPLFAGLIGIDCYGGLSAQEIEEIRNGLPVDDLGADIVRYALTRLGDPYSQSKRGSDRYVDCSYLVRWAYNRAGVSFYSAGTAAEQARYCVNNDMTISRDELKPGDVIFWRKNGCLCAGDHCGRYKGIHHVAIYIGDGRIIEASSSKGCVVINKIWGGNSGGKWEIIYFARPY